MSLPPRFQSAKDRDLSAALRLLDLLQQALQNRDRARQIEIIRELVGMRAPMGEQWRAVANLALARGEISLARTAMELFVEAQGGDPAARYLQAALLEQAGALAEALAIMRQLPANVPDPAGNAFSLGTAALYLGEREEARAQLERAVAFDPRHGAAWLSLAANTDLAQDVALADRIIDASRRMEDARPQQLAPYCHALGKAHADRAQHDAAFVAYSRGAAVTRSFLPFDRSAATRRSEQAVAGYTAAAISGLASQQDESTDRAIFVTGLPRSGTTLVEQILASHSAASDGGETGLLGMLANEVRGISFDAIARHASAGGSGPAARLWRHLLAERFPRPGRVIDKSLDTPDFIGVAATLLPQAPLIWLTRDPLDCAWSCLRTYFPVGMAWSTDQQDIAFQFDLHRRLLDHWQQVLGDRLMVVPLERLVDRPEQWIARIVAHCGLAMEPQVFAPHETQRGVRTASTVQVRRPINRAGIGSSEPYRAHMEPFLRACMAA